MTVTRPASFDALVLQWLPFLRRQAFRYERNAQDREDLVQETIMLALRRWESFREDGSMPKWLGYYMLELRGKFHRNAQRNEAAKAVSRATSPRSQAPTQEVMVEVSQVMDAIKPRYRSIVLRLAMGCPQREVAAQEGVSKQAIQQRLAFARADLWKVSA